MDRRIETDRSDSDATFFWTLTLKAELLTKLTVAAFMSLIPDQSDRIRYRHLYRLVRASGIGEWADVLDEILTGPTFQVLPAEAREAQRELNQNLAADSWQYESARLMHECLNCVSNRAETFPSNRVHGRRWFRDFATLRNTSRGHGLNEQVS